MAKRWQPAYPTGDLGNYLQPGYLTHLLSYAWDETGDSGEWCSRSSGFGRLSLTTGSFAAMYGWYQALLREVSHFDSQQWLIVMIVAVGIGYFALRGVSGRP